MFSSLKEWIINKLGGFTDIDTFLDTVDKDEKIKILTLAVKRLYNTVGPEDILKENELGQWISEGKQLSKTEKESLIIEAGTLLSSRLWKYLQSDIKYQANRKMFLLAKSEEDLTAGKLWLYTFDAIKTRLESISKGSGKFSI
jgi:hypothetical protein